MTGDAYSAVGGVVGRNGGTLRYVSASGKVNSFGISQRGGLIGINVGHLYDSTFTGAIAPAEMEDQAVGSLIGSNFGGIMHNNNVSGSAKDQPIYGRTLESISG